MTDDDFDISPRKCSAHRTDGETPCSNWAVRGASTCHAHGAMAPHIRDAAARRVLQAKIQGQLEQRGWDKVTDPLTEYSYLAGEITTFRDLAREHVNQLTTWSYMDAVGREDAKAVVGVYERALDRCDKILANMIRLGLDHEALRQARERPSRQQAETLVQVLRKALNDSRVSVNGPVEPVILDAIGDLGGDQ